MPTQRQSNIELCRIASIIAVLVVHSTFLSVGYDVSFGVQLLAAFSIIGVNVFVMITGYFSTTPKKTSLINLAFICFFWMIIKLIINYCFLNDFDYWNLFFISNSNWFVPAYIILLFIAPILNEFCNSVSKKQLWWSAVALLILEFWFDWFPPQVKMGLNAGYSPFHFIVLYLIARAIKLHGLPQWFRKNSLFVYILCSLFLALLEFGGKHGIIIPVNLYAYNCPLVVLSSVAFLISFERMDIRPSRFINHIAKSSLAVLLGHTAILFLYKEQFKYIYTNFNGILLIAFWILSIASVYCAIVLIDQIRLLAYHPIDKFVRRKIKNNEI
jgi:surface polysaccharide O-acyltransferase-like enzyme